MWEPVDWEPFDVAAVDAYRDETEQVTYLRELTEIFETEGVDLAMTPSPLNADLSVCYAIMLDRQVW